MKIIDDLLNSKKDIYGDDIFYNLAKSWSDYLNIDITSADVILMMIIFKIHRYKKSKLSGSVDGEKDSIVDILGYAKLFYDLEF